MAARVQAQVQSSVASWAARPAPFSTRKHGTKAKFSGDSSVAERVKPEYPNGDYRSAVVYTEDPLPLGRVWQATVLSTTRGWDGGLTVGVTTTLPGTVPHNLSHSIVGPHEWNYWSRALHHNKQKREFPDLPNLSDLTPGQTVGLLVTSNGQLHLYLNGRHRKEIASGLPVNTPLWGAASVYGRCTKVKSEILSDPGDVERLQWQRQSRDKEQQFSRVSSESSQLQQRLNTAHAELRQKSTIIQQKDAVIRQKDLELQHKADTIQQKEVTIHQKDAVIQQKVIAISQKDALIRQNDSELQQRATIDQELWSQVHQKEVAIHQKDAVIQQKEVAIRQKDAVIQQKEVAIRQKDAVIDQKEITIRQKDAVIQQKVIVIQQKDAEIQGLQGELQTARSQQRPQVATQEIAFWQVSRREVVIKEDRVLGRGAWGVVCEGSFRGQRVAVKCVYPDILLPQTRERIRREIGTMAQVRHPNLVLFMAAVLEDPSGPKIITEIMDTSLRSAYETQRLGDCQLRVFRDVAAAMNYLHCQREPILHRDLSTANVLLEAMGVGVWKAKVSDFGSANLVRLATTLGEGAIVYTAPEAFPRPPGVPTPAPAQTPKIDVYSYGVLVCEVVLARFPDPDHFRAMVGEMRGVRPALHGLVTHCIEWSPTERPSMADILTQLDRMNQ